MTEAAYDLVAITPQQMEQSHTKLISWAKAGKQDAIAKAQEAKDAYEHALNRKWKTSFLKRQWKREEKRVNFFEKVRVAIEAGFYIIPTFWMETFALRVPEGMKASRAVRLARYNADEPNINARALPAGEGEYVDPRPYYHTWIEKSVNDKGEEIKRYGSKAVEIDREIDFPAVMAKPAIMDRTGEAMALKVFDALGIVQEKKDPIIAGVIKHPAAYNARDLMFFIAWDFDPRGF